MSPKLDLLAIAERIRGLLTVQDAEDIDATARRLGADALRRSIDVQIPHPGLFVLVAIVRAYAIDPSWLLYGEYDSGTHSVSLAKRMTLAPSDFIALAESPRFVTPNEPPELRPRFQLDAWITRLPSSDQLLSRRN